MTYPKRVQYRERQRLRTADLQGEQEYLLALAGRHNVGVHGWGIVRGLRAWLDGNIVMVEPGLAVDGYGRTILVRETVRLQTGAVSKFVFLFACQIAQGGCGESPSTRCRDEGRVILSADDLPLPDIGTNFEVVRAAGLDCDYPPWPVLLGEIQETLSGLKINTSKVRSTRVNVAQIAAASKSSIVRIGKSTLGDQYPFLIAAKDKTGSLSNRVAADQENNVQIWGDLIVTESKLAPILLNVANELLRITPKSSAGGELRWRSLIQEIKGRENLVLEFRDLYANKDILSFALDGDAATRRSEVKEFNSDATLVEASFETGLVAVRDLPTVGIRILLPQPKSSVVQNITTKTVDNHDSDFRYLSPMISFEPKVKESEREACGCRSYDDKSLVYPNGIAFKAGLKPPAIPSRDLYNIKVGEKENQHEQLRASIGKFEEGDLSRRFSVGAMREKNNGELEFNPWLKVRGNAAVELPGGQTDQSGVPFLMLVVKGTLRLPPVKPDPRDPVFKALLLMAFFHGVLSHGGSSIEITFTALPDFFETAQDLTYTTTIKNLDFIQSLSDIKGHDRLTESSLFTDLNLPTTGLLPQGSRAYNITHHPIDFFDVAEVTIEIGIEGKIGDRKVASLAKSVTRPVITSPFIDLTMIPAEVPAGWSKPISIENNADRDLTINGDLIAKNLGLDQPLTPAASLLHSGEKTKTSLLKVPEDLPDGQYDLEVELKYHWPLPTDERTIKTKQLVEVVAMLTAETIATPVANAAWTFDLKLTNPTENRVTLLGLKVFVTKTGTTTEVDFTLNEVIRKHQSFTQHNIDGIIGLSNTVENIRIEMKFRRKHKTWESVVANLPDIIIP